MALYCNALHAPQPFFITPNMKNSRVELVGSYILCHVPQAMVLWPEFETHQAPTPTVSS
jgi:hypothetical protein